MWEHTFVTAEANARVRFRRAIERRALWMAEDAARELPNLSLEDALQLVHLYASGFGTRLAGFSSSNFAQRTEVQTFTLDELDAISAELPRSLRAVPVFAALTGLRPCEWSALERGDVDRRAGVVTVRRTVVAGVAKPYGKTDR